MTHNVTLPNGFLMTDVPDDATQIEVAKHAIEKGYAAASDFQSFPAIYSEVAPKQPTAAAQQPTLHDQIAKTTGPTTHGYSLADWASDPANVEQVATAGTNQDRMPTPEEIEGRADAAQMGLYAATAMLPGVAPVLAEGSIPAKLALSGAINTVAGAATHATTDNALTDLAEGAGGEAVAAGAGAVLHPLVEKFSPTALQYLKGFLHGADDAGDLGLKPPTPKGFKDAIPEVEEAAEAAAAAEKGAGAGGIPGEPGAAAATAKAASKTADRLNAVKAEQAQWIHGFHQVAAHRMSSLEAESYLSSQLAKTATGAGGTVPDGLKFYRKFIQDYETDILPHPGDTRPELAGLAQYEAIMRNDAPAIDKMITAIDAGEDVHPQALYDAIEVYSMGTKRDIEEWFRSKPKAFVDDLIKAERLAPGINEWLDSRGALGMGDRQYVSDKLYNANRAGLNDASENLFKTFAEDIRKERALTSEEYQDARADDIKNLVTALDHKLDALDQMQKNITVAEKEAKGIKLDQNEAWKELTPDQEAIYWGMINTHDAAERGAHIINQYRRMISLRNALPGRRVPNAMDRIDSNLTAGLAGFMTGGPVGAVAAPLIKSGVEKGVRLVKRKVIKNAVTRAIEEAAKQ